MLRKTGKPEPAVAAQNFPQKPTYLGYKLQFITLAGFHALNTYMFELSKAYKEKGMAGFLAIAAT